MSNLISDLIAKASNAPQGTLDELVINHYAEIASLINNEGIISQINALINADPKYKEEIEKLLTTKETCYNGITYILHHDISWFFKGDFTLTKDLRKELEDEVISRVPDCIIEGYSEGELTFENEDIQIRGGWHIADSAYNHKD
jgi:hypothetical protein